MAKDIKKNDFLPVETLDPSINEADFTFVASDKTVHEQKFVTKPTTFFKDSMKRFSKNKSSVVAGVILGFLLLLSVVVPIFDTNDISSSHPELVYLEPKLFNSGTGFWDGTKQWNNIPTDISANPNASSEAEKQESWFPNPDRFIKTGVTKKVFSEPSYTTSASRFGKGGYALVGYYNTVTADSVQFSTYMTKTGIEYDANVDLFVTTLDTVDGAKLKASEGKDDVELPQNYELAKSALWISVLDEGDEQHTVQLTEYETVHNVGTTVNGYTPTAAINVSQKVREAVTLGTQKYHGVRFYLDIKNAKDGANGAVLLNKISFESESASNALKDVLSDFSISDATSQLCETAKISTGDNLKFWSCSSVRKIYLSQVVYCSFIYDSYEANLGTKIDYSFTMTKLEEYRLKRWLDYFFTCKQVNGEWVLDQFEFQILNKNACPIVEEITRDDVIVTGQDSYLIQCKICQYKYYGYSSMPIFLFGTDKTGRDMFKYVFEGLRTSLLLGILTFAVCFTFGLVWGAISGYYGGTVDLLMERFTDILSGVPWIVVMTLVIIHMGSNFWTFAIAMCLTGWIGTSHTTRTQFYRFRGREYVLASRTLGASNARLIAKHILPNAMGTIITGAVLMIPSVIFSEATISYLGLGLKNLSSLGVILSNNQSELSTNAYLLIFPAVVIALLMICFNLFGNGLRDAINPSLKGEEQ